nr:uncharacterized protein LOC129256403 [Lytechinus pictus]
MAQVPVEKNFLGVFIILQVILGYHTSSSADCQGISSEVTCTCDDFGHCERGTVQVDPWLQNTLRTQMDVQLDLPFNYVQFLDAHNSYNTRPYGYLYGANDSCLWPPPYNPSLCTGIANQEFSLTDLLNMGIRAIELDNWYCEDEMRIAHLGSTIDQECNSGHVLFSEPVAEIGAWLDDHEGEFVRIYMNEKYDQGNDGEVNGPFERYLGDRVLTPANLRNDYNNEWPTLRTMREDGKDVVIAHIATAGTGDFYLHQGKFIHPGYWKDKKQNEFSNYPQCGGKNSTNALRFYSDSTHFLFENDYIDGPTRVGIMESFSEFIKCGIQFPAGDQVHPQLMETAVYTWAKGEPATPITDSTSCIMLSGTDNRWYTPTDCNQELYYACQNVFDTEDWTLSVSVGSYEVNTQACPDGYRFALPQNGFQHQKMLEAIDNADVWLNVAPLLDDYQPPVLPTIAPTEGGAQAVTAVISVVVLAAASALFIL